MTCQIDENEIIFVSIGLKIPPVFSCYFACGKVLTPIQSAGSCILDHRAALGGPTYCERTISHPVKKVFNFSLPAMEDIQFSSAFPPDIPLTVL